MPPTIEERVSRCCKEWMPGQTHWLEVKREMEAAVLEAVKAKQDEMQTTIDRVCSQYEESLIRQKAIYQDNQKEAVNEAYGNAERIVHNNGFKRPSEVMALIRAQRRTSPKLYGGITAAQHREINEQADRMAHRMFFRDEMEAFGDLVEKIGSDDIQEPTLKESLESIKNQIPTQEELTKNAVDLVDEPLHYPGYQTLPNSIERFFSEPNVDQTSAMMVKKAEEVGRKIAMQYLEAAGIFCNRDFEFGVKEEMRRQEDDEDGDIPLPVHSNWNTRVSIGDTTKWRRECFDRSVLHIAMRSYDNFIANREEPITATPEEGCVFRICCGRGIDLPKASNDNKHDLLL